jgi:hypothetical protein
VLPSTLKPGSTITATFSEKVKGVSGTTMKLYRVKNGTRTRIRAVVTVIRRGKAATLNPNSRLRAGKYLVVFIASKIHDVAGNTLVPSQVAPSLRSPVGSIRTYDSVPRQ